MIKSFRHKGLERFFLTDDLSGIQPKHADKLRRILDRLHAAKQPKDMALPGYRLHSYQGNKKGEPKTWSVDVSGNWRVTFVFVGDDAEVVDYIDPH